jgi:hypothetical protein
MAGRELLFLLASNYCRRLMMTCAKTCNRWYQTMSVSRLTLMPVACQFWASLCGKQGGQQRGNSIVSRITRSFRGLWLALARWRIVCSLPFLVLIDQSSFLVLLHPHRPPCGLAYGNLETERSVSFRHGGTHTHTHTNTHECKNCHKLGTTEWILNWVKTGFSSAWLRRNNEQDATL